MLKLILAIRSGLRSLVPGLTLAGLVFAAPAWGQAPASATRLQSLVNDAAVQLKLSYRQDPAERDLRRDELGRAIAAWNKSARSEADNERLAEWLRAAMLVSMPGSREPLPALPEFQRPAPPIERTAPNVATPNLKSITRPSTAVAPGATAEPTPVEASSTGNAAIHSERADAGAADESKEHGEMLPTFETPQPGSAMEKPSAGASKSEVGTQPDAAKQPAAANTRANEQEGDPFRDDPLPTDK